MTDTRENGLLDLTGRGDKAPVKVMSTDKRERSTIWLTEGCNTGAGTCETKG